MIRALLGKLRGRRRRGAGATFDDEIATHIALLAERYRAQGMHPEMAVRAARFKFGNTTLLKEDRRAMQGFPALDQVWQDLRYAARVFRKSPAFSAAAVVTLALGIGANTALFSVVSGVLLHPLPFKDPGQVMLLEERWLPRFPSFEATPEDFEAWRERTHSFEQLAAFEPRGYTLTGDGPAERIAGARVSANLPSLLGVHPILGRGFEDEDDHPGADHVVLLGFDLWHRRFAADPHVIGRVVTLDDLGYTVIGVMPPDFRFPQVAEIWKPMGFSADDRSLGHFVRAVGRLKPGVTRQQAQAELDLLMPRLSPVWRASAIPLLDYYVGDLRTPLLVLLGAAGLVLLMACVNVANLQLARGSARREEIALRFSLGATRGRVLRQLLTECGLLAVVGGSCGVVAGMAGIAALKTFLPAGIPRMDLVGLDLRTLLYTVLLTAVAVAVFGILPALRTTEGGLHRAATGGRAAGTDHRGRLRHSFMVAEISLALVLLTGAGLLLKSFNRLVHVPIGFQTEKLMTATISLPPAGYATVTARMGFVKRLLEQLQGLQGIRQAAISAGLPFAAVDDVGIRFERPTRAGVWGTTANYYAVTPTYFKTMGIPLIRGRFFTDGDDAASLPVVVINETMARTFFPNEDPIGRRLDISGPTYLRQIVGVAGDVKQSGLKARIAPQVYEPFLQKPATSFHVELRGVGGTASLAGALRDAVMAIDRERPVTQVRTMDASIAQSETPDRLAVFVLLFFAVIAVALAATGVYGVFAYTFRQRAHEMGVRLALGARQEELLTLALGQCLRLILLGGAIGLAASAVLTRFVAALLYQVKPIDPAVWTAVSAIIVAIAFMAALGPAWRASKQDPVAALKGE